MDARPRIVAAVPAPAPAPAARPRSVRRVVTGNEAPAIDLGILGELRDVMGNEFVMLVKVFLEDAPLAIGRILELAQQGDVAALAAPAHTLKSTSANLGALLLSNQARSIELDARQDCLTDALAKAEALEIEFERVAEVLRQQIA